MTGANVASLISSTTILQATTKNYNLVNNNKGSRDAFHEASRRLLLLEKALQTAKTQLDGRDLAGASQSAMSSLEGCNAKAKLSEIIFKDVAQTPETSKFERDKAALRREREENTVEVLVKGMMKDVCDLAEARAIEAPLKTQVEELRDTIEKFSTMEPSVPNDRSGNFSNYGSGNQFNAPGGTRNNNTGSGNQLPGANFNAPVTFSKEGSR